MQAQEQLRQRDVELAQLRSRAASSAAPVNGGNSQALASELATQRARCTVLEEQLSTSARSFMHLCLQATHMQPEARDSEASALRKKVTELGGLAQTASAEATTARTRLAALEQQLEAVRRERAPTAASQQGLASELRSKTVALEQRDAEVAMLKRRLEQVASTGAMGGASAADLAQLRTANAELTLRLNESEAVQEQLQSMLRKTATQLKAAVSSVRLITSIYIRHYFKLGRDAI